MGAVIQPDRPPCENEATNYHPLRSPTRELSTFAALLAAFSPGQVQRSPRTPPTGWRVSAPGSKPTVRHRRRVHHLSEGSLARPRSTCRWATCKRRHGGRPPGSMLGAILPAATFPRVPAPGRGSMPAAADRCAATPIRPWVPAIPTTPHQGGLSLVETSCRTAAAA